MNSYQLKLFDIFKSYVVKPTYPVYPPYHVGNYLEDHFIEYYISNDINSDRFFIPASWTTIYIENKTSGIQKILDSLDNSKKYFTVSQHDDAISEILPINTYMFNAGGNVGGIPIPLICSPIDVAYNCNKDIFCSFVGSLTHNIRHRLYDLYKSNNDYLFSVKSWSSSVSDSDFSNFRNITSRSKFCLCPRGYGRTSFRLYESMQLGSIPVYIYDDKWIPFEDELDWTEFSVLVHSDDLCNLDDILRSYSDSDINYMSSKLYNIWSENFTMNKVCEKIINRI